MDSPTRPEIDPHRVRRIFERRTDESFVTREIGTRMAERLDLVKIDPRVVLEAGQGHESDRAMLLNRYPKALTLSAQIGRRRVRGASPPLNLTGAIRRVFSRGRRGLRIASDAERLPFAPASVDMVYSHALLEWIADGERVIAEWSRILRPGGLLMFSTLGPDTLIQVREAFAAADAEAHTIAFTDLHDYGDMLSSHGFVAPVMDMERLTLTFTEAKAFWTDVRGLGGNPLLRQRRGLASRRMAQGVAEAVERQRDVKGQLGLTFEIVYGHAWKGEPRRRDGLPVVSMPAQTMRAVGA